MYIEDYSDRIGEPVKGYIGTTCLFGELKSYDPNITDSPFVITTVKKDVGGIDEPVERIEFLIPSVFRHYGKRAMVDDMPEVSIIFTTPDGFCYVTSDLKKFESGSKDYRGVGRSNYKLLPDTHIITIDGKDHEITPEQKEKIM